MEHGMNTDRNHIPKNAGPRFPNSLIRVPSVFHPWPSLSQKLASSRAKSVNYVRAFWKRRSGERGGQEAGQRALVLAGGVARWPGGPAVWGGGWQGGQEGPRAGGRGGKVAKRALVLAGGVARWPRG